MSKNKLSTEAYKGVRDFYPEDWALLSFILNTCRSVAERFGYVEYGASILEPSELYKSKGSENEEIVNEQTYTFRDRGDREVTLRPEMTPTIARMVAGKRRELGFPLRLFSIPNLFRYERPQRGRLREHWQLNVDLFGSRSPGADAEIVQVAYTLMRAFGATDTDFEIRVGSRAYIDTITSTYDLSDAQKKKLLGLLDRRAKISVDAFNQGLAEIAVPASALDTAAPEDVAAVLSVLSANGITNARFDPSIVRGFDYYTGVVFEVYDTHPENNRALFGGGRYDNLVEMFDDEPISGVGFGMGDVTIHDFLAVRTLLPKYTSPTKVYVAVAAASNTPEALAIAQELRAQGVSVAMDFGEKKLTDQIKTATKHRIKKLLVIGDDEIARNQFTVRDLDTGEERTLAREALAAYLSL